jgi:hypothetical protein
LEDLAQAAFIKHELQRQAQELAAKPAKWMPWIYREAIRQAGL